MGAYTITNRDNHIEITVANGKTISYLRGAYEPIIERDGTILIDSEKENIRINEITDVNYPIIDFKGNTSHDEPATIKELYDIISGFFFSKNDVDVNVQDQHTELIDSYFLKSTGTFTLAEDTIPSTVDSLNYEIEVSAGHGIIVGDELLGLDLVESRSAFAVVIDVVGDTITLDRPVDYAWPAGATLARIVTSEMAVDGSLTPQIFTIRSGKTETDITRMMLSILSDTSMDDARFGSLAPLTNGLVLRIFNGSKKTIFNFKTNRDIKQWCYDLAYSTKAPAGFFGLSARVTFSGQSKHGVVIRLGEIDALQFIVQDDLTGLTSLKGSVQGHLVTHL